MNICGHEYKVVIAIMDDNRRERDKFYFGNIDHAKQTIPKKRKKRGVPSTSKSK